MWLARRLTRWWYHRFDAILTVVPAGRDQKRFAGPLIDEITGLIPILADLPLSIAVVSYNGHLHFSRRHGAEKIRRDSAGQRWRKRPLQRGIALGVSLIGLVRKYP